MASELQITTNIPARMDRLPWARWHWLIVCGLGVTWILDGLEVTLAGAIGGVLKETFNINDAQVGATATAYLIGAVVGALGFGYATDRLGRKKLFTITLAVYLIATLLTACSWNFASYLIFRLFTGMGIGGEYAAINSAIDELIPARVRGRTDLIINSTYWAGAALGSGATIILLDGHMFAPTHGWRFAFLIGAILGLVILLVRHFIPESPRWLMTHGRHQEAEQIVSDIEAVIAEETGQPLPEAENCPLNIRVRSHTPWNEIWIAMFRKNAQRSVLGLSLMIAQAFFYNAIFFTYALLLIRFYNVPAGRVGLYILPFALGNVLGPILLGHLFDSIGRKPMIALTYSLSGIFLSIVGWMFVAGKLTAMTQSIAWTIIFFIASCAASSAYLTVSEIFPLEIRGMAISLFYAVGTLIGGVGAPLLFGYLIGTGSKMAVLAGYLFAGALMVCAAIMEAVFGIKAERQSLESISSPLTSTQVS